MRGFERILGGEIELGCGFMNCVVLNEFDVSWVGKVVLSGKVVLV